MKMELYFNTVCQERQNAKYPYQKIVESSDDLAQVVAYDHVCAEYRDDYRKNENFIQANCAMFDIDNTETDDSANWIKPEDVQKAFPNVPFYVSYSRNHMKSKNGKVPRPKFHVYFPHTDIHAKEEYCELKNAVATYFTAFDQNAKDAARFFFGVETPNVEYYDGSILLTDFIKTLQIEVPAANVDSTYNKDTTSSRMSIPAEGIIPEGQRNITLFKYALEVQKCWGPESEQAKQAFRKETIRCSPPLPEKELASIWESTKRYYRGSNKYVTEAPDDGYALPVADYKALAELLKVEKKDRKFQKKTAELILQAFGISIKMNDMNRQTEIYGLPDQYNKEDASNLLAPLIADIASDLCPRRASTAVVQDTLNIIANENHYHPVLDLLNEQPWDRVDRISELYEMLHMTDEFEKTLVKKWALQTIAVLYNTMEKPVAAQGVLVLQGDQGIGKTEFFRHLAIQERFFKGGATLDMSNKDSLMSATKVWICELGEIDSTTKKEQSAVKAFLTETTDRFREPYARCETIRPRRTSFGGTVNPKEYLRDETGNRRYWTIPINQIDTKKVFEYTPEWYAQFWRQIHEEYKKNPFGYLLTVEEKNRINASNTAHEAEMYGEDEFLTYFDITADISQWRYETAANIANALNEQYKKLNITSAQVGKLFRNILNREGIKLREKTVKGKRLKCFPPVSTGAELNDRKIPYVAPTSILEKSEKKENDNLADYETVEF